MTMKLFAALLTLAGSLLQVQPPPSHFDISKVGPQIGQRVPDFSLKDQSGTTQTVASIMGPKGAMLVFFRSADW